MFAPLLRLRRQVPETQHLLGCFQVAGVKQIFCTYRVNFSSSPGMMIQGWPTFCGCVDTTKRQFFGHFHPMMTFLHMFFCTAYLLDMFPQHILEIIFSPNQHLSILHDDLHLSRGFHDLGCSVTAPVPLIHFPSNKKQPPETSILG